MSLYEEAKAELAKEEQEKKDKVQREFHGYKLRKMKEHIRETEKNAKALSLSDEKAKEIEAITLEQYKALWGLHQ